MTLRELTRLVALGEGLHLEFKRRVPQPRRMAKEIIAFANTKGGHLLVGVDDDGTITGVRDAEEEEFSFRQALEAHCMPPVRLKTERVPISRKRDVIMVRVPPSPTKPHYLVDESPTPDGATASGQASRSRRSNGNATAQTRPNAAPRRRKQTAYVRVKDMSVEASKEAVRLMRLEKNPADVQFEFGDKELKLMRYLDQYGRITVEQFANLAQVPKRSASQTLVLLTRADVLAFHHDARQDFFTLVYNAVG